MPNANFASVINAHPSVTADGLAMYFQAEPTFNTSADDLFVATRATETDPFGSGTSLSLNTPLYEITPYIVPDGSAIYYAFGDGGNSFDIYRAVRAAGDADVSAFTTPSAVGGINTPMREEEPVVTADELTIYYGSNNNNGQFDIYVARRSTATSPFGTPAAVTELDDPLAYDAPTWISPDQCEIWFMSNRSGSTGGLDIYMARKPP
jgi:Tol biopolymer transport system component